MFESARIGHRIDRETYRARLPALREALLDAQFELGQSKGFSTILLFNGPKASGKAETTNQLLEWLDPRFVDVNAPDRRTEDERERPPGWRYWNLLPPRGRISVFLQHWYSEALEMWARGRLRNGDLAQVLGEIARHEKMLADEGVLLLKFHFHVPPKAQRRRLERLAADPTTAWRVTKEDWKSLELYDRISEIGGQLTRLTNHPHAPWLVIEGTDDEYRNLAVGEALLAALRRRLDEPPRTTEPPPAPIVSVPVIDDRTVLRAVDLSKTLGEEAYARALPRWQGKLATLMRGKKFQKRALVAVFEGNDAAGKGGAIRRVAHALDARTYSIVPIAAPTDEELARPYLWRFWRRLPRRGHATIFDRSWYGRVLVERVEGFCREADWQRAYVEIVDFEAALARAGVIVVKFWLSISQQEQLRRFQERERLAFKRFKITPEDWRNREKWDQYEAAVCEMVDRTSTREAPWSLVPAEDKRFARIEVLRTLCRAIEERA